MTLWLSLSLSLLLAETAGGGGFDGVTMSVAAVTALGVAVAAVVKAFKAGEERGKQKRVVEPNPLPVTMVSDLATKEELRDLEARLVVELKKLEVAISGERAVARTANGNLHARIDKLAEGLAGTAATMTQLNAGLNRVLDMLMAYGAAPNKQNRRTTT